MTQTTPSDPPTVLRRLDSGSATTLVNLLATFEDLQMVLRCCERLMSELGAGDPDDVAIEGVWTTAVLSYARCFSTDDARAPLTEDDLTATLSNSDVLDWHRVLLQLRQHYAHPSVNPRERFSVGVAQAADGTAGGIGVTSARQPSVDDITVRQTGAIAFGLSKMVNDRIADQQAKVFDEVKDLGKAELDRLAPLEVAPPDEPPDVTGPATP
jgi:hypothetical protein